MMFPLTEGGGDLLIYPLFLSLLVLVLGLLPLCTHIVKLHNAPYELYNISALEVFQYFHD